MAMAFFDIGALITLGTFFLLGRSKGFAWQVAGIASLILGYIAARIFSAPLSAALELGSGLGSFVSWLIIYILVATGVYLIARGFKRSLKEKELDELDKHLGGVLGLLKGGLLVFLVSLVGLTLLPQYRPKLLATITGKITARIVKILEDNFPEASREAVDPSPQLSIPAPAAPSRSGPALPAPTRLAPPPAKPEAPPPAPADAEVEERKPTQRPLAEPEAEPSEAPDQAPNQAPNKPLEEEPEPAPAGERPYDPFRYDPIKPVKRGR